MRARVLALVACVILSATALSGCFGGGDGGGGGVFQPRDDAPAAKTEDPGWPAVEDATIRPGVRVVSATGQCTSNFVFKGPLNETLYLGLAAHCVTEDAIGDRVDIAGGAAQGIVAYSSFKTMEEVGVTDATMLDENDFALIAIPEEYRHLVHPAVLHFGGPTALADAPATGERVLTYGNTGLRQGVEPSNPREGVVTTSDEWYTSMYIAGPGLPGDSGSGVMNANAEAFGVLVHLQIAPTAGGNGATNLPAALAWMTEHTGLEVTLATAPVLNARAFEAPGNATAPSAPDVQDAPDADLPVDGLTLP